jgi:hypothetical protein
VVPEDIAMAQFKLLDPQRFIFLQRLTLFQDFQAEDALSLKIELLSDKYESEELHLSFYGIQQLQMGIDRNYIQVKIEIISMHESRWERWQWEKYVRPDLNGSTGSFASIC